MNKEKYKPRIMDKIISSYFDVASSICIEGIKWCGKTTTAKRISKSQFYVGLEEKNSSNKELAIINPKFVLDGKTPRLIDEWQNVPALWEAIRWEVDLRSKKNQFILTGSSTLKRKKVLHNKAERIVTLKMSTMSLFESNDSEGLISINELLLNNIETRFVESLTYKQLAYLIVRGGWPENLDSNSSNCHELPKKYINKILEEKSAEQNIKYNFKISKLILKSLARNFSTTISERSIITDILKNENKTISRPTLAKYIEFLNRLFLFDNLKPYHLEKSKIRTKWLEKRYFSDPSLVCALLDLTAEELEDNFALYQVLFKSLVIRDLKVYAQANEAKVFHYEDYLNNKLDVVIEFKNGSWCAVDIILGWSQLNTAARKLNKTVASITRNNPKPPVNKCIIVGFGNIVYKREEDGIIVIPINALKD
ncbi:hypothetical protein MFERI15568_00035 [Mycoplasma feriruminatoris]|uniref:ATP-binding protein n=1 Tax=Mycoplasma feriruminatoris TaxID=1179777 RepID=UPI00241C7F5B|nr:AAA family ATPase [Mycoplasma feriruminatoris]WFQ95634.1 hypothetical protein MFERI15568_00035 [Mycoplasma feriruminatoris]